MNEEFKEIPHLPNYYVNKNGEIMSGKTNKIMSQSVINGYKTVSIGTTKNRHLVHRLVALTYLKKEENKNIVNHKDSNRLNNSFENLEWVTQKENVNLSTKIKAHPRKIKQIDVISQECINVFNSITEASTIFKISRRAIQLVLNGKNKTAKGFLWKYEDEYFQKQHCDISSGKKINNYENYLVFPNGSIYNTVIKRYVKPIKNASGYCYVSLSQSGLKKNFYIHRLIAEAFLTKPDNCDINHKNKKRDDNCVDNLEWVSKSVNNSYIFK